MPNGDFSVESDQRVNFGNRTIQVGSKYRNTVFTDYTISSSIDRGMPSGWSSINAKTCFDGASNANSWYVVPSTFLENGRVIVRTVGYSHNGKDLGVSGNAANFTYYGTNYPEKADLNIAIGELFLGSYAFDSNGEQRVDGVSFTSRPLTLSFQYRYTPCNNENAEAYIKVLNSSGKEISQGVLRMEATSEMKTATVVLDIYEFGENASLLQLGFKSTSSSIRVPEINIPTGSALDEGFDSRGDKTKPANDYKAFAKGSELIIDDVRLGYDPPATMR